MPDTQKKFWIGKYWYIPIAIIIITGYVIGIGLWYSVLVGHIIVDQIDQTKLLVQVFSLGLVGATISSSAFFAKDANTKLIKGGDSDEFPNFMDPIGYVIFIIGGGVTALVLYFAVKAGVAVFADTPGSAVSTYGAWLVALTGGVGTQRVKSFLIHLAEKTTNQKAGKDAVDRYRGKNNQENS